MENINEHIETMLKPYRDIQKITGPFGEMQSRLKQAFEPLVELQRTLENISRIYESIPAFAKPFLKQLYSLGKFGEQLKEYAEKTPDYLLLIAKNGWFLELESELSFPSQIAAEIQNGSIEKADRILIEYYSANLDRIFNELIIRHPDRSTIFNQIQNAYKNGEHFLLIPVALAQIDGICFDFTKRKFFIKEKDNRYLPQITSELEKSADNFLYLFLSPIKNQIPIIVREKDINRFPCHLNRHNIMHGVDIDYGTEINSLKVISLLKYISDILIEFDHKAN